MPAFASQPQNHPGLAQRAHDLLEDLEGEVQRERHHDTSQSDLFLRKHVMGLIVILFALVAVLLAVGMAVVGLYYHPH